MRRVRYGLEGDPGEACEREQARCAYRVLREGSRSESELPQRVREVWQVGNRRIHTSWQSMKQSSITRRPLSITAKLPNITIKLRSIIRAVIARRRRRPPSARSSLASRLRRLLLTRKKQLRDRVSAGVR